MGYLVQYRKNNLKSSAIEMRKRGLSYNEIKNLISISKGTLSRWLREVELTGAQKKKLEDRRRIAAARGSKTRKLKTREAIEKIKQTSAKDVKKISPRELWLMGIMILWREKFLKNEKMEAQGGVKFSSSNPGLIRLFLKWLQEIGGLKKEEITFSIFLDKKDYLLDAIKYWSEITGFSREDFARYYLTSKSNESSLDDVQKGRRTPQSSMLHKKNDESSKPISVEGAPINRELKNSDEKIIKNFLNQKPVKRIEYGFLQVRVKASSMLARQISGWINGIQEFLLHS